MVSTAAAAQDEMSKKLRSVGNNLDLKVAVKINWMACHLEWLPCVLLEQFVGQLMNISAAICCQSMAI